MDLELVKKHLRVLDDFEDEAIEMYKEWAETKVQDAVTNDPTFHTEFFNSNSHYERAVILLTAHYFSNRLPLSNRPQYNLTFGLRDALSHLQANFLTYLNELSNDEPFN